MTAAITDATGQVGLGTSQTLSFAPVAAGEMLIAFGVWFGGSTRTFTTAGGTWVLVFDDFTNFACYVNYNPTVGSTSVQQNASTSTAMLGIVMKVTGLKSGGARYVGAQTSGAAVAAWAGSAVAMAADSFVVGTSYNSSDKTPLSTAGAGFAGLTGTGLTTGNLVDLTNADILYGETGNFSAGTITAAGLWGGPVNWLFGNTFGFELAPPAPPAGPSLMGHCIYVTA